MASRTSKFRAWYAVGEWHESSTQEDGMPRPTSITKTESASGDIPARRGESHRISRIASQSGCYRAIIAIHEGWGLNTWVKEQATNLAANAYVVLALDLYQGRVTANSSEARKLKRALPEDRAILELTAAFDYLAHRPDVHPKHIGSLGWSMGGGLALQLAIHEPRLAACVVNYGSLPTNPADLRKIHAQTLGIFDNAGHAFENPANKRSYRPEAAADAWFRTLTFLDQSL
jgi:carboxymethylenebutenolidase